MILAIASGKGGTGKTSLSVNLVKVLGNGVQLLDCDVEEPNAHLFIQGTLVDEEVISILVPEIDVTRCNTCGKCVNFCEFNALALVGGAPLVFPEMCHACGGCALVCTHRAIREKDYRIGVVKTYAAEGVTLRGCAPNESRAPLSLLGER